MSHLLVEGLGGDRRLFLLLGGFLLGLKLLVVLLADAQPCLGPMMAATIPRCFASSSSIPPIRAMGVGVRGEDVELSDGHVVRGRFLCHDSSLFQPLLCVSVKQVRQANGLRPSLLRWTWGIK